MNMVSTLLGEHETLAEKLYQIEMNAKSVPDESLRVEVKVEEKMSKADEAFYSLFPCGFQTIETPSTGFLCALHAICLSLEALAETDICLQVPKVEDLLLIIKGEEFKEIMMQFGVEGDMMNTNYFGVDQAALAAQMWAEQRRLALRFGYIIPDPDSKKGHGTFLLPYAPLKRGRVGVLNAIYPTIVFIYNNNVEAKNKNAVNHFEGIRRAFRNRPTD